MKREVNVQEVEDKRGSVYERSVKKVVRKKKKKKRLSHSTE